MPGLTPAYFVEADPARILAEYPIGEAFLAGPARLSADALRALQEKRFLDVVARAWQVPFYARRWRAAGLEPGAIRGLVDIEAIPPYSKADLMASIEAAPPFGDYHGVDFSDPARPAMVMHTTSGTTGAPQPLFYGAWDREVQNALVARAWRLQGLRDADVVHSVYGFGMVNGGHYVREALLHFTRAILLPAGTGLETPSAQQVELMRRFGATVLVGFVDYLVKLAEVARERGLVPGRDLPVRMISGHLGSESRAAISALWGGAAVYDWYGVGDTGTIAAEGPTQDGLHVFEDAHYVEALDPDSGRGALLGAGSLCCTVLFKRTVYPVIRFNTQDVTELLPADGASGIGFRRMAGMQGRADAMLKLRGVNVHPAALGAMIAGIVGVRGEYYCRVERRGSRDEMTVVVETGTALVGDARDALVAAVRTRLRERLNVDVAVEPVAPGTTADITGVERRQKPIRLVDLRK
ncbi:MAG: phenylacetate--CoA ligase family protein [Proteobacteria bacterium]|nr:phenylacetate--CoA ligase family protein [Pseudomonadota bacterium]